MTIIMILKYRKRTITVWIPYKITVFIKILIMVNEFYRKCVLSSEIPNKCMSQWINTDEIENPTYFFAIFVLVLGGFPMEIKTKIRYLIICGHHIFTL